MNEVLMELKRVFQEGRTYLEYIMEGDEETQSKHLHYRDKMVLTHNEAADVDRAPLGGNFLVFCDTACNDCRIVSAMMDQIQSHQPSYRFRYALRKDQEELMKRIDPEARIPMVVQLMQDYWKLVFYEVPQVLIQRGEHQTEEERRESRVAFQRGLWKDEVLREFLSNRE